MYLHPDLARAAYDLAEEVREGRWDAACPPHLPSPACPALMAELDRRCPGFLLEERQEALAAGLRDSR